MASFSVLHMRHYEAEKGEKPLEISQQIHSRFEKRTSDLPNHSQALLSSWLHFFTFKMELSKQEKGFLDWNKNVHSGVNPTHLYSL